MTAKDSEELRLSFEVFPPKTEATVEKFRETLKDLASYSPEFISVTCGAGGTKNAENFSVCQQVLDSNIECAAHLTCIGASPDFIGTKLKAYKTMGVNRILALRGDYPAGITSQQSDTDLRFASDLVKLIQK